MLRRSRRPKKGEVTNNANILSPPSQGEMADVLDTPASPDQNNMADEIEFRRFMKEAICKIESKLDTITVNQFKLTTKVSELEEDQREFKTALEYSETTIEELQTENLQLKDKIRVLENKCDMLHQQTLDIKEDQLQQERYSRGNNIRIVGIEEQEKENAHEVAVQFLREKFNVAATEVENAHRTGKKWPDKPQQIIAKLHSRITVRMIMKKQKETLADLPIYITNDMPRADFMEKRRLKSVMKSTREDGKSSSFRRGKVGRMVKSPGGTRAGDRPHRW